MATPRIEPRNGINLIEISAMNALLNIKFKICQKNLLQIAKNEL